MIGSAGKRPAMRSSPGSPGTIGRGGIGVMVGRTSTGRGWLNLDGSTA